MPEEFVRFGESWLEHHPGWEMRLWRESDLPPLRNQVLYDSAASYSEKSDIIRFELLLLYGGVYVDCDFECLRSIEPLLLGVQAFAAFESEDVVNAALMGAVPGHSFLEYLVDLMPASVEKYGHANAAVSTGPDYVTRCLAAFDSTDVAPVTLFPSTYFYPYPYEQKYRRYERFPHAYAVHHWAESWLPPEPRLKRLIRSALMSSSVTRRVFYVRRWLKARMAHRS